MVGGKLPLPGLAASFAVGTVVKALVWLGPMLFFLLRKDEKWLIAPRDMFISPFPWLPSLVGLCLTAAFLHTMHILLVGIDTWGIFQPMWIFLSLGAALIEELAFRGFLFNRQAAAHGAIKAALINGLLFALYHFPEFIIGQNLHALLGLRFWVIAVMGYVFSMTFAKWKNLGMTMIIHFVWNMLCHWFAIS